MSDQQARVALLASLVVVLACGDDPAPPLSAQIERHCQELL